MRKQLATILLMGAMLSTTPSYKAYRPSKSDNPPNGNCRRTHKQNVKRRRLRHISKKSKSINR